MNIYILNLNKLAYLLLKPINFLGIKLYYLNYINLKKITLYKNSNLIPIKFNDKNIRSKRLLKLIISRENDAIREQINNLLPERLLRRISGKFYNIDDVIKKLQASLISKFNFYEIGRIYIFDILNSNKNNKIIIIHTNLNSFFCRSNGVNIKKKIIHLYLPTDDIIFVLNLIKKIFNNLKRKSNSLIFKNKKKYNFYEKSPIKEVNTAIVIHRSLNYGAKLYIKNHFFSSKNKSKLNIKNLTLLSLEDSNQVLEYNNKPIIRVKNKINLKLIYKSFKNIIGNLFYARNLREIYSILFIFTFYLNYISWIDYFKRLKIKNIIYDYDILFSKSLSLALESSNIKTIALQERATNSNAYIFPVFVDAYLYAGSIAQKYGIKNETIFHKEFFNLGMWRVSYFFNNDLISKEKIRFKSNYKDNPLLKKQKILFLGFHIDHNNYCPFTNYKSLNHLIKYIKISSKNFPKASLILRMKILKENDVQFIMNKCKNIKNFYLCHDYDTEAISYRLCKESDLIVSLSTSLAEESLAYGKKVVFINDNYPIKKMTEDWYVKEFAFTISKNKLSFIRLAKKCLENHEETNKNYKILKNKLSGSIDLSRPNIIPDTIEKFLV